MIFIVEILSATGAHPVTVVLRSHHELYFQVGPQDDFDVDMTCFKRLYSAIVDWFLLYSFCLFCLVSRIEDKFEAPLHCFNMLI